MGTTLENEGERDVPNLLSDNGESSFTSEFSAEIEEDISKIARKLVDAAIGPNEDTSKSIAAMTTLDIEVESDAPSSSIPNFSSENEEASFTSDFPVENEENLSEI